MAKTKSVQIPPRASGRPLKFQDPIELFNLFQSYMAYCEENKKLPNIAGFVKYICDNAFMISRDTFYTTANREGFSDTINYINTSLEDSTLNNDTQSNLIRLAYLNNKCGYVNTSRTESKNITLNVNAEVDSEERSKLIADLLLKRDSVSYPRIEEDNG